MSKYVLVIINLENVNVYHDISTYDFITIWFHWKTINDNIELSPSPSTKVEVQSKILTCCRGKFMGSPTSVGFIHKTVNVY